MFVADDPARSARLNNGVHAVSDHILYQRTINLSVSGQAVDAKVQRQIQALLPIERSNLWWITHKSEIEREITSNAHIATATVAFCRDGWIPQLRCFDIALTARSAEFLVMAASDVRLVAGDGVLLDHLPIARFEQEVDRIVAVGAKPPRIISGIYSDQPSPDIAAARFERISKGIIQIESRLNRRAEKIEFINSNEVELMIEGNRFPVRFGIESLTTLEDQVERYLRLEREIASKRDNIELIDMAFDKLGVVRYSQSVLVQQPTEKSNKVAPQVKPVGKKAPARRK